MLGGDQGVRCLGQADGRSLVQVVVRLLSTIAFCATRGAVLGFVLQYGCSFDNHETSSPHR